MTGAGVLVQDALFATLEPAVRKARTPGGRDYTLTDTVGFIRHLPHDLVEAFKSTLEEVRDADLILHVVDGSDEAPWEQVAAVRTVLGDLGAGDVPELVVINKADVADPDTLAELVRRERGAVIVSALTGEGVAALDMRIEELLPRGWAAIDLVIPFDRGELISRLHRSGRVDSVAYRSDGTHVIGQAPEDLASLLREASRG